MFDNLDWIGDINSYLADDVDEIKDEVIAEAAEAAPFCRQKKEIASVLTEKHAGASTDDGSLGKQVKEGSR
jgi:hypothetical protein